MLLVIGLDGATFDLLQPWMEEGELPTLQRLAREGASGTLRSTLPPVTAPAWASFMTGKNPGKHGIFDFFHGPPWNYQLHTAADIRARLLWEYLSETGRSIGVINLPLTHPPRPVNGYLIPGLLSPREQPDTFPADLLSAYTSRLGPYRVTPQVIYQAGNEASLLADLHDVLETRLRYALALARDRPAEFMMVHFLVTDIAQHAFWKHADPDHPWHDARTASRFQYAIRDIYRRIDAGIDELLSLLPDDRTVVIMSDHGFGPLHRTANLNLYLIESGLMRLKPAVGSQLRYRLMRSGLDSAAARIARRLGQNWTASALGFQDVDWSRTLAYSFGHLGQIYINLQGRQPRGCVHADQYMSVRDRVVETLLRLPDPLSGLPLVDDILPREEAAHGPQLADGPDLHVIMDAGRTIAYPAFTADGKIVTQQKNFNSGDHRRDGLLIAHGPQIRPGTRVQGASILDLAPTLLHLMETAVPHDMDGRVLAELLTPEFAEKGPRRYVGDTSPRHRPGALTRSEQTALEDRLRGLGYLGRDE